MYLGRSSLSCLRGQNGPTNKSVAGESTESKSATGSLCVSEQGIYVFCASPSVYQI